MSMPNGTMRNNEIPDYEFEPAEWVANHRDEIYWEDAGRHKLDVARRGLIDEVLSARTKDALSKIQRRVNALWRMHTGREDADCGRHGQLFVEYTAMSSLIEAMRLKIEQVQAEDEEYDDAPF